MANPAKVFMAPHLVDWYIDIYTNLYGVDNMYTAVIQKFNTYLKEMVNTLQFKAFSNAILTIGVVLLLFYFFTDLTEKATLKQLSTLQMGKSFCVVIAALFVIFNTKNIFIFMMNIVEDLNSSLTVGNSGHIIVTKVLSNEIIKLLLSRCVAEHFSLWSILGYTLIAFILALASLIVRAFVSYFAATRILQLFIYYIFAPIGVSDIFENGPGGTINMNSSGFRYLKTILAIMLQIVVITVVCQTYPLITTAINAEYFSQNGDDTLDKLDEARNEANADDSDSKKDDKEEDSKVVYDETKLTQYMNDAVFYPLKKFQYTNHKSKVREIIDSGVSAVKDGIKELRAMLGKEPDENDDIDTGQTKEKLKDSEIFQAVTVGQTKGVINVQGKIENKKEAEKILDNSKYRMTIESTERFFDWCVGSNGSKMIVMIILLITKVILIQTSAKICNQIVGTSI